MRQFGTQKTKPRKSLLMGGVAALPMGGVMGAGLAGGREAA